jgi:hypothetical protein
MQRLRWVDRSFSFGLVPGLMPNVLERLRGTPERMKAMVAGASENAVSAGGQWSIKDTSAT